MDSVAQGPVTLHFFAPGQVRGVRLSIMEIF